MDEGAMVHIYSGIVLNHKKDILVLMRWMNLEFIIQSDVSQKEKNRYCILMQICEIWLDGTDKFVCRAAMEMQT